MPAGKRGRAGLEKTWYTADRSDVASCVPRTARRILDVGCARGELGLMLKQRGEDIQVTGVEMSREMAEVASRSLDSVLIGTIEELLDEIQDEQFDCIIFADVLEHLINPFQILLDVRPKLRSDGLVVASIPNVRHYSVLRMLVIKGRWDYYRGGLLDSGHLRFFTRESALQMFRWAGYRPTICRVNTKAPQRAWLLNRLALGRLAPFLKYQYIIVADPAPEFTRPESNWWSEEFFA